MTANQIAFYKAKQEAKHWQRADKESKRHDSSTEAIQSESNRIQEWWNQQNAAHLIRSDAINMAHYERMDSENRRHNIEGERLSEQSNLLKYNEYLLNKDVKQRETAVKEREAAVKEGQLILDTTLNPFRVLEAQADATYSNERAKTEASKRAVNEATADEKTTKSQKNVVNMGTDTLDAVNHTLDTLRKFIPIIGWH